jgi:hypothetical protein
MFELKTFDSDTLQKNIKFWMVSNRPEIEKNHMGSGPDGLGQTIHICVPLLHAIFFLFNFLFLFLYILIPILTTADHSVFRPEIGRAWVSARSSWICQTRERERERSRCLVPVVQAIIPFSLSSQGSFKVSQAVVPFSLSRSRQPSRSRRPSSIACRRQELKKPLVVGGPRWKLVAGPKPSS